MDFAANVQVLKIISREKGERMKLKYIRLILAFVLVAGILMLSGCDNSYNVKEDKINVVCTTFSQYDWVRELAGENINDINLILLGNGADLHSYQPTTGDIITISEADMFIYVGGVSEAWVDEVLKQADNKDMVVINMMEILGDRLFEEEHIEGMEEELHEHGEDIEYDEHIWLSLKNAIVICKEIRDGLVSLDGANEKAYQNNYSQYIGRLEELDREYKNVIDNSSYDTLLFADRFPFIYMVKDYGLKYYAAFVGCSAETEASFETVTFLADKLDEMKLPGMLIVEGSKSELAKTINESTSDKNYSIYTLDSMQNVTMDNVKEGKTYIDTMKSNLEILKKVLDYTED